MVISDPRAHFLFSDKRVMALLRDECALRSIGMRSDIAANVARAVPPTVPVTAAKGRRYAGRRLRASARWLSQPSGRLDACETFRHSRATMMYRRELRACPSIVRPFEVRRMVSACVTLILLAIQVFGTALTPPPAAAFDPDRIEICTESGLLVLGHDGQPEKAPQAGHGGHCLFCLPLLHAGVPPTAGALLSRLRPAEHPGLMAQAARLTSAVASPLTGAASPHAPPVSA